MPIIGEYSSPGDRRGATLCIHGRSRYGGLLPPLQSMATSRRPAGRTKRHRKRCLESKGDPKKEGVAIEAYLGDSL